MKIVVYDGTLQPDIVERAALIGGTKLAQQLKQAVNEEVQNMNISYAARPAQPMPVSPDSASPFQRFYNSSRLNSHLIETAFHTVYFVVASAYDHEASSKGQPRLLWRTKMTVDAQGVSLRESIMPLIASSTLYLGRDMSEVAVVTKRISREGKVEIGEAKVVEEDVKTTDGGKDRKP